jgi:hypothetical protein
MAVSRWQRSDLDRPLDYDEWHTIEFYGWAGLTPAGDMRALRRNGDFESLAPPNLRQLGLGLYRATGLWKEPNNHVINSFLVNLTTAVERSPRAVRIPAFVAGILYAVLVFVLIGCVFGWWWAAPIAGIVAYGFPYVETFGSIARGYTMVLAFQVLFIIVAALLSKRPGSVWLGAAMVALAAGCFVNVISLAVDWVLPVYAALFLFSPSSDRTTWRRSLLVQALALAAMFGIFAVDRLPAMLLASQRFGEPVGSLAERVQWVQHLGRWLFPTPLWLGVAACGAAGLVMCARSRSYRFVSAIAGAVLVAHVVHLAAAKRWPYFRVCGYFLPLLVIGFAALVEQVVTHFRAIWRWPVAIGATSAVVVLCWTSSVVTLSESPFTIVDPRKNLPADGVYKNQR